MEFSGYIEKVVEIDGRPTRFLDGRIDAFQRAVVVVQQRGHWDSDVATATAQTVKLFRFLGVRQVISTLTVHLPGMTPDVVILPETPSVPGADAVLFCPRLVAGLQAVVIDAEGGPDTFVERPRTAVSFNDLAHDGAVDHLIASEAVAYRSFGFCYGVAVVARSGREPDVASGEQQLLTNVAHKIPSVLCCNCETAPWPMDEEAG